jgi:hypothetical protein
MPQSTADLDNWLVKIRQAKSHQEVFQLLDEFRPLEWSDEQRAAMAKAYMKVLEATQTSSEAQAGGKQKDGNDGPVWYEKM